MRRSPRPAGRSGRRESAALEPRALLRRRVRSGRATRAPAESLLPRRASAPRRPIRRRPRGGSGRDHRRNRERQARLPWRRPFPEIAQASSSSATASTRPSSSSGPENSLAMLVLNTRGPLFRNNPKLRQAVNFAVDRSALTREPDHSPVPPQTSTSRRPSPGIGTSASIRSRDPTCVRARARRGQDTEWQGRPLHEKPSRRPSPGAGAPAEPEGDRPRGRDRAVPGPSCCSRSWPLTRSASTSAVFNGAIRPIPTGSVSSSTGGRSDGWATRTGPTSTRRRSTGSSTRASRLPLGSERDRTYGGLDVRLSRDAAPAIPFANLNAMTFVSARVGCVVLNPYLDLTAVCP